LSVVVTGCAFLLSRTLSRAIAERVAPHYITACKIIARASADDWTATESLDSESDSRSNFLVKTLRNKFAAKKIGGQVPRISTASTIRF
jgi:hypothetical protein